MLYEPYIVLEVKVLKIDCVKHLLIITNLLVQSLWDTLMNIIFQYSQLSQTRRSSGTSKSKLKTKSKLKKIDKVNNRESLIETIDNKLVWSKVWKLSNARLIEYNLSSTYAVY